MANTKQIVETALDQGKGVFRLAPTWVPRAFCIPGKRLKLHPNDYYAFGAHRGGIDERWFASTTEPAPGGRAQLAVDEAAALEHAPREERRSCGLARDEL